MLGKLGYRARGCLLALSLAGLAPAPALPDTLSGAYLAAMQADFRNDYAAAARYFAQALARDPENPALLQNTIAARIALGEVAAGVELAPRLASAMPENQFAALALMADALQRGDYDAAAAAAEDPALELNPLLAGLVTGWIEFGREDFDAAMARFDALSGNEALEAYGQYHKALALALAGDFGGAEAILAGDDDGPLHPDREAVLAHAEILAQIEREDDAVAILEGAMQAGFPDAALIDLRRRLIEGGEVAFTQVAGPSDGAAEAFFTLGTALNTDDADRFALIYARLAHHIAPEMIKARLLAGEILERHGQHSLAADALGGVDEASPWFVTSELRRAATQRGAGDPEAGIATLEALAARFPELLDVHSALGDALRAEERYAAAAEAYSRAVDLIEAPQRIHWPLYYTRAIAHERAGDWEPAEADFRQALALEPDQPLVLNYLGYSLVEQQRNLDEALDMIERAVAGQPDDGYITDSLGWVLYRLGRFEEALPHMLRAVELLPADAVINDHLGDVLWKVGREREARFQWRRSLSLGPADDLDMDRVRAKLDVGLAQVLADERAESRRAADGDG
ncbi:tetratricopeptide repeat protein [soil metagenome]